MPKDPWALSGSEVSGDTVVDFGTDTHLDTIDMIDVVIDGDPWAEEKTVEIDPVLLFWLRFDCQDWDTALDGGPADMALGTEDEGGPEC